MSSPILFEDFDPSSVNEAGIRNLTNSVSKIVWLNHGRENSYIRLQTKMLRTPTGVREVKKFDEKDDSPPKYTMELALDRNDPEYRKLEEFDARIVQMAMDAKGRWIKSKSYDQTAMENMYTPCLRIPIDKETGEPTDSWPPTLRLKVEQKDGSFNFEAYDIKRKPIDIKEYIANSKNSYVTAIVRCTGVWLSGKGFGVTWKLESILVHSTRSAPTSFCFIDTPELKMIREMEHEADESAEPRMSALSLNAAPKAEEEEYLEDSE